MGSLARRRQRRSTGPRRDREAVDAVGHVCSIRQGLKSVGTPDRNVQRYLLFVLQLKAHPIAERRRGWPQVNDDVKNGAIGTTNELRFTISASHMQASDDS